MTISIIVAMDKKGVIGKNNSLPWKIKEDLQYFKQTTQGHAVIMGRKTYESIGKALPNRDNIVLSNNPTFFPTDAILFRSFDLLLDHIAKSPKENYFVIGGSSIYRQFLPYAEYLYITHIDHEFEGDTYFPSYNETYYELISESYKSKNNILNYNLCFAVYKKIKIK